MVWQLLLAPSKSPGVLSFFSQRVAVRNPGARQFEEITLLRTGGCSGSVLCEYRTERMTAVPGYHYTGTEGVIEFEDGVTEQTLEVEILPKSEHRASSEFLVLLEEAQGASLAQDANGAPECNILLVEIPPVGARRSCLRLLERVNMRQPLQ
ncbi:unnamed protein product [Prorocentrum cordatum]|uniref:Calx-beta domain-containing protein n=1 Tax=Prorocentrum cordatum TaxID=2364126 RepID=A0ABN9RHZ9_9DINO|nr:unnamed protein product [Polarella glacialis]